MTTGDVYAQLERLKELWQQLEHAPRASRQYWAIIAQIRAESLVYLALLDAQPPPEPPDTKE